jgi:hypothetical protein
MNLFILNKTLGLNNMCIFLLVKLTKITYFTIYKIEISIKLNKNLTTLVKMVNGF